MMMMLCGWLVTCRADYAAGSQEVRLILVLYSVCDLCKDIGSAIMCEQASVILFIVFPQLFFIILRDLCYCLLSQAFQGHREASPLLKAALTCLMVQKVSAVVQCLVYDKQSEKDHKTFLHLSLKVFQRPYGKHQPRRHFHPRLFLCRFGQHQGNSCCMHRVSRFSRWTL